MATDIQRPSSARPAFRLAGYAAAAGLCALATLAAVAADRLTRAPNLALVYVLPVVIAAVRFGAGPALAAAALGVGCFNFFLVAPRYTLRVGSLADLWGLALLLVTAVIVSTLAAYSRRQAFEAARRAGQADALQGFARAMVRAPDDAGILKSAGASLDRLFGRPAVALIPRPGGFETSDPALDLSDAEADAARLCIARREPSAEGAGRYAFWPVTTPSRREAALGLRLDGGAAPPGVDGLMEIVAAYLGIALERSYFAAEAADARVQAEGDRLKGDLLAAVSHDLKTPLSTILLTLQSLRTFGERHDAEARTGLLSAAEAETARLAGLVDNLLDMNRLQSDALTVRPRPTAVREIVEAACRRAASALDGHALDVRLPDDLPWVMADPSLAEAALGNVLDNAGRYSPAGAPVRVSAKRLGQTVSIEVRDEGAGFPPDLERLFDRFTRGVEGDGRPPGTGLGLAIARGFMRAQGGDVRALNAVDGPGARVLLQLPVEPGA